MIETPLSRRRARQRVIRRNNQAMSAIHVVSAMCRGESLQLHYDKRTGAVWRLTNGRTIDVEVAEEVLRNPHVIGVGDCLFDNTRSQTYRYISGQPYKPGDTYGPCKSPVKP